MGSINKTSALLLTLIIAVSCLTLLTVKPVSAQTIPKPSVPEFTVRYVDSSYYVPPTYGVDEYSGMKVQTGGGFTNYNKTVELSIKPQPFTPYVDGESHDVDLEYIIEYKGHFGEEWKRYPNGWIIDNSYNTILFGLGSENSGHSISAPHADLGYLSAGDQVDFRVKAQVGYYTLVPDPYNRPWDVSAVFTSLGESGWSNTKTLTIPGEGVSSSTPNPSPTVPELSWLVLLSLCLVMLPAALVFRHRKNRSRNDQFLVKTISIGPHSREPIFLGVLKVITDKTTMRLPKGYDYLVGILKTGKVSNEM